MNSDIYITASTVISNQVIYRNGVRVFEKPDLGLSEFLLAAYGNLELKYPKFYKMDILSKLGWLGTEILLNDQLVLEKYTPESVGVVLTNANSCIESDIKYFDSTKEFASPALFVYTLPNIVIGEICIRHRIKGENAFFIFEDFNTAFIEQYISNLINNNILQCCICGWVELLGDEYKTVLYLVEKGSGDQRLLFTIENLHKIYQLGNG